MPMAALRTCTWPGCSALVAHGRCSKHAPRTLVDQHRGSARQRGYTAAWDKERTAFLAEHPLCRHCHAQGRVELSRVVDHTIPHRGNPVLFCDPSNRQALCTLCHARKGQRENKIQPCPHTLEAQVMGRTVCALCGCER